VRDRLRTDLLRAEQGSECWEMLHQAFSLTITIETSPKYATAEQRKRRDHLVSVLYTGGPCFE
jgi:hypothetical protein